MTPILTINLLRTLFVTLAACVGLMIAEEEFVGMAAGAAFGLAIVLCDKLVKGITLRIFSSATFGLLVGFIFAKLLLSSRVLAVAPPQTQWVCGLIVYATFSYLGMMLAIRSNRDEFALIIPYVRFRQATVQDAPLLIDSNIIIDGRIAGICATGFLSSSLVVPRFVLEELQRLADSGDTLKRERGRAALDRLQQMQRDPALTVTIHESESADGVAVDTRLLLAAKMLDARLLTNDGNLCALARLQGVSVLNLHDLTKALRPTLAAGEALDIALVKEGRDAHQAVGYLPDGTMVVVNHARQHMGKTVPVVVASTLQTSAGRLFFADLRAA
ncbi:MAG: hypothetical protein K8R23_16145 [Chthoniobacter sp.]|nr:hypothetical protein [Chthoniobacter sp.]